MARLIKHYDNRKLYDTERKSYVSLDDLAELVRQGHDIRVLDNSTGEDLTAQTLTKIIVEGDRRGRPALPSEVLHELVRWGGKVMTTTADQLEQRLDKLVLASVERLGPIREIRQEMDKLRERILRLEVLLAGLARDLEESQRR